METEKLIKPSQRDKVLRLGYTTSACASAASAAAVHALIQQRMISEVTIELSNGAAVEFVVHHCEYGEHYALCSVIKDSGDDKNDVTNGIEIQAKVEWKNETGIVLRGGKGVGIVTLPGLPISPGEAAINPLPRKMIVEAVEKALSQYFREPLKGLWVTIQVPQGEEIARKTMNPDLGIVGGISILGTDGIQRPFSLPSYRASIYFGLKVPYCQGIKEVGIASGRRSLAALTSQLASYRKINLLEVGDEIGYALRQAARLGYVKGYVGIMPGKLTKVAQGRMQTHVNYGKVDFEFLSTIAKEIGLSQELSQRMRNARTVHQALGWLSSEEQVLFLQELAKRAAEFCKMAAMNRMEIGIYVFSINGDCYLSHNVL